MHLLDFVWIWASLYMVSWATGFSTMHLYLPICSQVRLGRVMFASEMPRREPLWIHWYLGLGKEVETHCISTLEPRSEYRMPLKSLGSLLSRTLSGPSAKTRQETWSYGSDAPGSCLPQPGDVPLCTLSRRPRPTPGKAAVPTTMTIIVMSSIMNHLSWAGSVVAIYVIIK